MQNLHRFGAVSVLRKGIYVVVQLHVEDVAVLVDTFARYLLIIVPVNRVKSRTAFSSARRVLELLRLTALLRHAGWTVNLKRVRHASGERRD